MPKAEVNHTGFEDLAPLKGEEAAKALAALRRARIGFVNSAKCFPTIRPKGFWQPGPKSKMWKVFR